MDYGKIAHYKSEELENRMVRQQFKAVSLTRLPARLTGNGLVIIRVRSSGEVSLYAGDTLIGQGSGDFTVAAAAGNCILSAAGAGQFDVTAAGGGITLKEI